MIHRSGWDRWRLDLNRRSQSLRFQLDGFFWGILALCIGCGVAISIALFLPVSTKELEEAKELGIVSVTILNDYPDGHETNTYIYSLIISLPLSFLAWCLLAARATRIPLTPAEDDKNSHLADGIPASPSPVPQPLPWFDFLLLPILLTCLIFDGRFFTEANNTFVLLAEEGQFADWVQKLRRGGIFHQDGFSLYGPLMVYPIVWLEEIFGSSLVIWRIYRFILDVLAYMLFYFVLKEITGKRGIALAGMLIFVGFYFPWFVAPNGTMLRIVIGLLPIILCYRWFNTQQFRFLIGSGIAAGLIVFYSQEVGAGTMLAVVAMLVFSGFQETWKHGLQAVFLFVAGLLIGAAPVLIGFEQMGALQALFMNLTEYPQLAMLGYAAIPFPSLISAGEMFITNPGFGSFRSITAIFFILYGPIILYSSIVLFVFIRWLVRRSTSFDAVLFGIACFGLIYYLSAMARSGFGKSGTVFPPGLVLSIIVLWWLWHQGRQVWVEPKVRWKLLSVYAGAGSWVLALLISYGLWYADFTIKIALDRIFNKVIDAPTYWVEKGFKTFDIPALSGLYGTPEWVERLEGITAFIRTNTRADEYVFVFPNEPMYYRLLERPNPTRWGNTYNAITSAHRNSIVEDLERTKPQWVLYSLDTWRIDMVPEKDQVPEITAYLERHYELEIKFGGTHILKRNPPVPFKVEKKAMRKPRNSASAE